MKEQCDKKGFFIKVDEDLKRKFNIACIENNTNMSEVIKDFMQNYIDEEN